VNEKFFSIIPRQYSSGISFLFFINKFPNFDKCFFLECYAAISVNFFKSFQTKQSDLTSSVKHKVIDTLLRVQYLSLLTLQVGSDR